MSAPRKDSHEVTEDSEAYRIGEPIEQAVDYVIDTIKERKASMTESKTPHDVTEDIEAYRIGEVVEHAVDHVIDKIQERKASKTEEHKEEHHKPAGHKGSHSERLLQIIDKK